ncbi:hypothetical protein MRS44_004021 [Fusarium solani]|uniref:uncharacterized protein n=1 Tax=Fusarium solani TaxID=169388 RepID=UPI0032C49A68|nr:hypothetical protein MRS44_004021 [Fusarium solani]
MRCDGGKSTNVGGYECRFMVGPLFRIAHDHEFGPGVKVAVSQDRGRLEATFRQHLESPAMYFSRVPIVVYGVKRLSVVDASVHPISTGGNVGGAVFAVTEKAAELIQARTK